MQATNKGWALFLRYVASAVVSMDITLVKIRRKNEIKYISVTKKVSAHKGSE